MTAICIAILVAAFGCILLLMTLARRPGHLSIPFAVEELMDDIGERAIRLAYDAAEVDASSPEEKRTVYMDTIKALSRERGEYLPDYMAAFLAEYSVVMAHHGWSSR